MPRSLTSAAQTEAQKQTGAKPVRILEVEWPTSGTKRYSTHDRDTPVVGIQGRLLDVGELQVDGTPGQAGGITELSVEFEDSDLFLKQENETQPGVQNVAAHLYLWFDGTTWPDDRVTLFGGVITAPMRWSEETGAWSLTLKGFEYHHDKEIGQLATQDVFPDIDCQQCENRLIPIVFGDPCYRVPACVIDRPGHASLAETLNIVPDTTLTINRSAVDAGFTTSNQSSGGPLELILGWPQNWERVKGFFDSSDDTTFTITERGAVLAEGNLVGFFGSEGTQYLMINKDDLPDAGATSRIGHPFFIKKTDDTWTTILVTKWQFEGTAILVAPKGDLSVGSSAEWKLSAQPSYPVWPPGTPVNQVGDWTYVVNFLPSKEVQRVEAKVRQDVAGQGTSQEMFQTINTSHYGVDEDNRSWNGNLNRETDDAGITTVTLNFSPTQVGAVEETVWVTLRGTTGDVASSSSEAATPGDVIIDPADVIRELLSNKLLGNVPGSRINTDTFTTAAQDIETKCSFALLDEKRGLHDLCGDLAHQAGAIYFWDQGQAHIKKLTDDPNDIVAGSHDRAIGDWERRYRSLEIEETDVKEIITEMTGKFRPAIPADELLLVRRSDDEASSSANEGNPGALGDFGLKRDELDLWSYQFPSSVALATEFWLKFWLHRNRIVTFQTFLNGLDIQPGDELLLRFDGGLSAAIGGSYRILDDVHARVEQVRHQAGNTRDGRMELITVTCSYKLYGYNIRPAVPSDLGCLGERGTGPVGVSDKLYLRSSGTGRSLFVGPLGRLRGDGGGNITDPVDSGIDPNVDINILLQQIDEQTSEDAASSNSIIAELTGSLSEGGSASAIVKTQTPSSSQDTTVTVLERLGLGTNDPLPAGTRVAATRMADFDNQYVVTGANCP